MAIPFFGPFVAVGAAGDRRAALHAEARRCRRWSLMVIGWFVVMNVLQPRIMQGAVGIHPIVVLGSVLIGSRIAGIPGAIFGIPIAAVALGVLLPLPPAGRRATAPSPAAPRNGSQRARGPAGPRPARAGAGHARRTSEDAGPDPAEPGEAAEATHVSDDQPGHDPGAGPDRAARPRQGARRAARGRRGAGRPARPARQRPAAGRVGRAGRGSSSPTTTASSRAGCSRSSRRSTRSAT